MCLHLGFPSFSQPTCVPPRHTTTTDPGQHSSYLDGQSPIAASDVLDALCIPSLSPSIRPQQQARIQLVPRPMSVILVYPPLLVIDPRRIQVPSGSFRVVAGSWSSLASSSSSNYDSRLYLPRHASNCADSKWCRAASRCRSTHRMRSSICRLCSRNIVPPASSSIGTSAPSKRWL